MVEGGVREQRHRRGTCPPGAADPAGGRWTAPARPSTTSTRRSTSCCPTSASARDGLTGCSWSRRRRRVVDRRRRSRVVVRRRCGRGRGRLRAARVCAVAACRRAATDAGARSPRVWVEPGPTQGEIGRPPGRFDQANGPAHASSGVSRGARTVVPVPPVHLCPLRPCVCGRYASGVTSCSHTHLSERRSAADEGTRPGRSARLPELLVADLEPFGIRAVAPSRRHPQRGAMHLLQSVSQHRTVGGIE